jgi:hypothetical protein
MNISIDIVTCLVNRHGVWFGNPIYWTLETCNYMQQ